MKDILDFFIREYTKNVGEQQQTLLSQHLGRHREVALLEPEVTLTDHAMDDDEIDLVSLPDYFSFEGFDADKDLQGEEVTSRNTTREVPEAMN